MALGLSLTVSDRLLVVAPHPDDETLGAGGLIQSALEAHAAVKVVVVTNGDGSTPAAAKVTHSIFVRAPERIRLGTIRQGESLAALALLGLGKEHVEFLGYPDKGLTHLWEDAWRTPYYAPTINSEAGVYRVAHTPHAPFTGISVRNDLLAILRSFRPTMVLIPSSVDMHPDHRTAALFTQQALADIPTLRPRLYAYLVHRGVWPPTKGYLAVPEDTLAAHFTWENLALRPAWVTKKYDAINLYKSQMMISGGYLTQFAKPNELFSEVNTVLVGNTDVRVAAESEVRAGLRDVAVDKESLLRIKDPGVWAVHARVEGGNLHVRLVPTAAKLIATEYSFLLREGDRFVHLTSEVPTAVLPLKGNMVFFLSAQVSDARRHTVRLPWTACEHLTGPGLTSANATTGGGAAGASGRIGRPLPTAETMQLAR